MSSNKYNKDSISVLEGLEAVRERPGMYIGNTNTEGLHHLLWEVIDNSIDEHLAGYANEINVTLHKDGRATVKDNGRGIPVDMHEKGVPSLRLILTTLHAGGKFDNAAYKTSGGLHGVGSSVVNALSKNMEVEVYREGEIHFDSYENGGHPKTELTNGLLPTIGKTKETGTKVTFLPDDSIFEVTKFDAGIIESRLKEKAYLNPELTLTFKDERDGRKKGKAKTFHEPDGLLGMLRRKNEEKKTLTEALLLSGKSDEIEVDVAFQHTQTSQEKVFSYVNGIPTPNGGTHVTGLRYAFTRLINNYVKDLNLNKSTFKGKDLRSGLTAIVSIKHPDPQFEGQTKGKLGSTDAKNAVDDVFSSEAQEALNVRIMDVKSIVSHAKRMQSLHKKEEALHKQLESDKTKLQVNGKLAHCSGRKPKENELFIVEGDSAGGTTKQGRNRKTQAVLPLRGKVLNVEKSSLKTALKNKEISSLFSALGAGIGDEFDISKLKYHKIILLTDADVDGSHIRVLLLTLFWRFAPELLLNGHVYRGVPPLYKVTTSSTEQYVYSDKELKQLQNDGRIKIKSIQRYKGLGEMDAEQLWDTTMNPESRLLERITIEDAQVADNITSLLMGSKTEPRKAFIEENAENAAI